MSRIRSIRKSSRFGTTLVALALSAVVIIPTAGPAKAGNLEENGFSYTVNNNEASVIGCSTPVCPSNLVIPSQLGGFYVTSIGSYAFATRSLTSVSIPNTVKSIENYAFQYNNLTFVDIPSSVTSIGNAVFKNNSLTSVYIPSSVTSIGNDAFHTNRLTSVTIPSSITVINSGLFYGNALTSVTFKGAITSIGPAAFRYNSLTSVDIPGSVTTIGTNSFANNDLRSVIIPSSVTSIGAGAFADNTNLSVVALRGNKPSTGTDVFKNTAATTAYVKVGATGFGNTYNGVLTVVIGSVPGSPSISTLVAGDGSATVTFVAPTASPIPAITDYRVEFIGPYDFSWSIFSHSVSASTLSYTITGLTNGTSYGVRVRAINALGSGNAGEPGDVVPAVPVTVPGAPTVSSFTAGNGSGTVTFSAPAVSGGFAITDYVVEYKTTAGSSWSTFSHSASAATLSYTISGLTNGTSYDVRVSAVNANGTGTASSTSSVTPATVPGIPDISSFTAGNGSGTVTFTAPADNGGSAITDYLVEYKTTAGSSWSTFSHAASSSTLSYTISGLSNGTSYDVRVSATNARGTGTTSSTSSVTPVTVPGAPTASSFTAGNGSGTVTFVAPADNGGSAITDYLVEYKTTAGSSWSTFSHSASAATLSYTISGLTNGTSYDVRVSAVNTAGTGTASSSSSVTPATVPGAPTFDSVTPGNGELTVVFSAPADNGGSAISYYVVDWKESVGGTWSETKEPGGGYPSEFSHDGLVANLPYHISGLSNGSSYDVRVYAVSAVGAGDASVTASGVPVTVPGIPAITSFTAGNGSGTVMFTAPTDNGGSAITDYLVEYKTTAGGSWSTFSHSASAETLSYAISGLSNGTSYDVRVSATNAQGTGVVSDSASVTPAKVPGAPTVSSFTAGNGEATVTFSAPADNGGSAITDYLVEYKTTAGSSWSTFSHAASSSTLSYTISGLSNGTSYDVRVSATNAQGTGVVSDSASVTPAKVPGAPTVSSFTAGDGSGTVTFVAPADNGGSAITDYLVEYKTTAGSAWSTFSHAASSSTLSYTISGLSNGTSYDVRVSAVNFVGAGTPSDTLPVTVGLGNPASEPLVSGATTGNAQVTISMFTPKRTGGTAIKGYQFTFDGENWSDVDPSSTSNRQVIKGLRNGTLYSMQLRAINGAGPGAVSKPFYFKTPIFKASKPQGFHAYSHDGSIGIEFEAPLNNGGSSVINYGYSINGGSWKRFSPASNLSIARLTNGTGYSVRVAAFTTAGWGEPSDAIEVTPHN